MFPIGQFLVVVCSGCRQGLIVVQEFNGGNSGVFSVTCPHCHMYSRMLTLKDILTVHMIDALLDQ